MGAANNHLPSHEKGRCTTAQREILDCIMSDTAVDARPHTTCAVLDEPVLVQMLRPSNATTISQYCTSVLFPYVIKWFENNQSRHRLGCVLEDTCN
ncbi:hypothetical protein Hamer_G012731 [Homarus americanus]|uniref:Uncharacterized protein n=1 Tax=Homarus americanus TaxID=6706 RepID=A0A8J5JKQ8_HOMAM|nr:hypothetical protein Hamer_G012731 [Homarus americanus]